MISAKIKTRIYLLSAVITLLLISTLLFSLFTMKRLESNLKIQVHTRTVILALKDNIAFLLDAESAERGYIITADTNYVQQYSAARQNIFANLKQLRVLVHDEPNQIQRLDTLDKFINQKLLFIDKLFSLKRQGDQPTINAMLVSNESKYLMDNIRSANRALRELVEKLFTERHSATLKSIADAKNVFIIEFILSLLITIFLVFTILSELIKRKGAEQRLNRSNIELKIKNRDLESKNNFIHENEKRISRILDALIKITRLDFSEKLIVSEARDELDAIALGLNTMSEEFEFHLNQLQQSEDKLNNAQRLARIGNWEMDMATKKVHWSNEMFNIYGYSNERFEVSFEKALERMLPEDREGTRARMKKHVEGAVLAFKQSGALEFESAPSTFTIILPDGSRKVVQGIGKIVLNDQGHIRKMVGTVQDITEQYKAEQRLHQYNIELERKNKEIEQFAYAASHDLQEPLRSISNFSSLLAEKLKKYSDSEINKYMSLVSGASVRMSKLIFALLDYSRIGKDMSRSMKDCNQLVQEVLTDLASIIEESKAEIHIETLPVINSYDLKPVFQNLIVNAIKFKKQETCPVINISSNDTGNEFIFAIKDNGIGIEKEYYDRIFIIFQRLHLRTEYPGTGIGLSLSKKIIELHGGKIWVESEFGNGSTFYFSIPKS